MIIFPVFMNYQLHSWHPLHASSLTNLLGSFLHIFALNCLKDVLFLSFMLKIWPSKWPKKPKGMLFICNSFYPLDMKVRVP